MLPEEAVAEITAQDAYQAAEERALKTTRALVLAEAQILHWKRLYVDAVTEVEKLRAERFPPPLRPKGVDGGESASDPHGYTAAVGQAD